MPYTDRQVPLFNEVVHGETTMYEAPRARAPLPGFARHSDTSLAAAIHIQPALSELQHRVLGHVHSCGEHGCTVFEAVAALRILKDTCAPRFSELSEARLIRDSGKRRLPRPGARTMATVWVIA